MIAVDSHEAHVATFGSGKMRVVVAVSRIIDGISIGRILGIADLKHEIAIFEIGGIGTIVRVCDLHDVATKNWCDFKKLKELVEKWPGKIIITSRGHLIPIVTVPFFL